MLEPTFSRSSNIQKKGVMAPMSRACVVTAMMWFRIRVISPNNTAEAEMVGCRGCSVGAGGSLGDAQVGGGGAVPRIHCARGGGWMLSSFSTASE